MKLLNYTAPSIEVLSMEQTDVIRTSGTEYGEQWDWYGGELIQ